MFIRFHSVKGPGAVTVIPYRCESPGVNGARWPACRQAGHRAPFTPYFDAGAPD